jgi:hypothetical protein
MRRSTTEKTDLSQTEKQLSDNFKTRAQEQTKASSASSRNAEPSFSRSLFCPLKQSQLIVIAIVAMIARGQQVEDIVKTAKVIS